MEKDTHGSSKVHFAVVPLFQSANKWQVAFKGRGSSRLANTCQLAIEAQEASLFRCRHDFDVENDIKLLFQHFSCRQVGSTGKGNGLSFFSDTARPTNPMHKDRGVLGQGVVDDMGDVRNVDTACCYIRCNKKLNLTRFDFVHDSRTFVLRQITGNQLRIQSLTGEKAGNG